MIAGPGLEGTVMAAAGGHAREPPGGGGRGAISRAGLRAAGLHALRLRRGSGLGPGGGGGRLAGPRCGDRGHAQPPVRHGAGHGSASTRRATSRASTRGNGTSGRRTAPTCRWNKVRPRNRKANLALEKTIKIERCRSPRGTSQGRRWSGRKWRVDLSTLQVQISPPGIGFEMGCQARSSSSSALASLRSAVSKPSVNPA